MKTFSTFLIVALCLIPLLAFAEPELLPPKGMVLVTEGVYIMGSHKSLIELNPGDLFSTDRHSLGPENPAHNVLVDSFYIDTHEVSHGSYMEFVKKKKIKEPRYANDPNFNNYKQPVVGVSWKEAQSYCIWKGGRLPTEAEWEKASRGKRSIDYPWGNEAPDKIKLNFNQEVKKSTIIGSYGPGKSDYDVYDLAGNVSEWVYDWHLPEFYLFSEKKNPLGPENGQYKVIRGGNWRSNADDVKMVYRNATVPSIRKNTLGFRCAQSQVRSSNKYPNPS
jgi:formylglycine-generating enzyme required for sulfatase activity